MRVDLPMPGSPPRSTTDPTTRLPPRTRSNSVMPEDCRISGWQMRLARGWGALRRGGAGASPGPGRGPTTSSANEFQAPHWGQRPSHLLTWWPQLWQVKTVLAPEPRIPPPQEKIWRIVAQYSALANGEGPW